MQKLDCVVRIDRVRVKLSESEYQAIKQYVLNNVGLMQGNKLPINLWARKILLKEVGFELKPSPLTNNTIN